MKKFKIELWKLPVSSVLARFVDKLLFQKFERLGPVKNEKKIISPFIWT